MANDINHVVLVGRLTRDAELKYTSNSTAISKFSIAVNRNRKGQNGWEEEAHFFDIVVWGRQGEAIQQYLSKGRQVAVQGELRQNRWEQNGQTRSKVEIHAFNVELLGGGSGGGGGQGRSNSAGGQGRSEGGGGQYEGAPKGDSGYSDDMPSPENFDDDIPF